MKEFEDIYETVLGLRIPEACAPGAENAFGPGSVCDLAYEEMRRAYERLLKRLGAEDNDSDLDTMVEAMERIQRDLCERMYEMGKG